MEEAEFVYLDKVCPEIQQQLRYNTAENFTGKPVDGYIGQCAMMTKQAAIALYKVQQKVATDGFSIVVYDAYRPVKAVQNFVTWSKDNASDTSMKEWYYPYIDKSRSFELGYIAERSGHSRGSTVDLTLISNNHSLLFPPLKSKRTFITSKITNETIELPFLDDGSVDMGTSFDLIDSASHYACPFIPQPCQEMRLYLRNVMISEGFEPYDEEWWHFTLKDEPYPDTYFDFDVC